MIKRFTKILGVIALIGWMGVANATLIFDFSWDSSDGKIIGEIYGLSNDGVNMEATAFVLTSVGGTQVNINVLEDYGWLVFANAFDVLAGEIISIDFFAGTAFPVPRLVQMIMGDLVIANKYIYDDYGTLYIKYGVASFVKRVTVPEPSSVILMLLGLVGLSFARYRKQY
jgi:hypothetical protein